MKPFIALALVTLSGCVDSSTAVDYARRAHPECTSFGHSAHRLSSESKTEVNISGCKGGRDRTITIKCTFGYGLFADTTCHENN